MSVEPTAGPLPADRRHRIDDVLWDTVWERQLNVVDRRNIALSVWRLQPPGDPFESLVGFELAFRWRARATGLTVLWGLWTVFWLAMVSATSGGPDGDPAAVPVAVSLVVLGVLVMAGCQLARARLKAVIDGSAGFRPGEPPRGASGPIR